MLSQRRIYLENLKEKEFEQAKKTFTQRQLMKKYMVMITFFSRVQSIHRRFNVAWTEYAYEYRKRLIVSKLKSKIRLLLKKKCRHPECVKSNHDFPKFTKEYIDYLHNDRIRNSLTFYGASNFESKEEKCKQIML